MFKSHTSEHAHSCIYTYIFCFKPHQRYLYCVEGGDTYGQTLSLMHVILGYVLSRLLNHQCLEPLCLKSQTGTHFMDIPYLFGGDAVHCVNYDLLEYLWDDVQTALQDQGFLVTKTVLDSKSSPVVILCVCVCVLLSGWRSWLVLPLKI